MPSVARLDELMRVWSDEWCAKHGFQNYFKAAWTAVEQYYSAASPSIRPAANFEIVLGEMLGLAHWMTPSPLGNALRQLVAPPLPPPGLEFPPGDYGATVTVTDQLAYLLIRLAGYMRGLCRCANFAANSKFSEYKALLDSLRAGIRRRRIQSKLR